MASNNGIGLLLAWLPPLGWAVVIWILGSGSFSEPETSQILGPLLGWLLPFLSDDVRDAGAGLIRKSAHVVEYGLLALLLLHPIQITLTRARGRMVAIVLALIAALATADEWRQSHTATRTGSIKDVAIDLAGAALALGLVWLLVRLRDRRSTAGPPVDHAGSS